MDIQHKACHAIDLLINENVPVIVSDEVAALCHFDELDLTELDNDQLNVEIEQGELIDYVIFGGRDHEQNS